MTQRDIFSVIVCFDLQTNQRSSLVGHRVLAKACAKVSTPIKKIDSVTWRSRIIHPVQPVYKK